jgi:hypothetical protein
VVCGRVVESLMWVGGFWWGRAGWVISVSFAGGDRLVSSLDFGSD